MNELAEILGIRPLFGPGTIDCHAWCPIHLEGGARLDCCSVCGAGIEDHDDDAILDDDEVRDAIDAS